MIEYVPMELRHVPQIAELEKECFSGPWSETSIASELQNPLSLWLVAIDGSQVAGYIGSQTVMDEADMMNLAVKPEYRRMGVAENLICQLISRLKENNVTCLTLEVRASNAPAISLYTKLNFVEAGRRPGYYHNPKEDALILRKEWTV